MCVHLKALSTFVLIFPCIYLIFNLCSLNCPSASFSFSLSETFLKGKWSALCSDYSFLNGIPFLSHSFIVAPSGWYIFLWQFTHFVFTTFPLLYAPVFYCNNRKPCLYHISSFVNQFPAVAPANILQHTPFFASTHLFFPLPCQLAFSAPF